LEELALRGRNLLLELLHLLYQLPDSRDVDDGKLRLGRPDRTKYEKREGDHTQHMLGQHTAPLASGNEE
jgi:hypothetical protein